MNKELNNMFDEIRYTPNSEKVSDDEILHEIVICLFLTDEQNELYKNLKVNNE